MHKYYKLGAIDKHHKDIISIPGAVVKSVSNAWYYGYFNLGPAKDVFLVCGLNNLAKGQTPEEVFSEILTFQRLVLSQPGNTFSVETLPLPPKIVRSTKIALDIISLNEQIKTLNQGVQALSNVDAAPMFHTFGLKFMKSRRSRPAGVLSGCVGPRHAYWREHDLLRKLHLSDHKRITMGESIDSYFRVHHLEIPRLATAKVDGLTLSKFL